jgi:hypothetical protein
MRIEADARIGEFGHVVAPNHDEALSLEARYRGRIGFSRRRIGEHHRARARDLALEVEQILDADGYAGERRHAAAGPALLVVELCLIHGGGAIERQEGPRAFAGRILDLCQRGFNQRLCCDRTLIEIMRQCAQSFEHGPP